MSLTFPSLFRSNGSRWRVLDRVGDLAFHGRTGLTVCDTNLKRQTTRSKIPPLSNPEIEENWQVPSSLWRHPISISNFLPTREKTKSSIKSPQHISLSASRVPQLYNQRLSTPLHPVRGSCLVPKLNWRMHCNSNFFHFLCLFFSYLLCYWAVSLCLKGKVLTLLWESGGVSVDLQFVLHIRVVSLSPVGLWMGHSAQTWD